MTEPGDTEAEASRSHEALTRADLPELVRMIAAEVSKWEKGSVAPLDGPSSKDAGEPTPCMAGRAIGQWLGALLCSD